MRAPAGAAGAPRGQATVELVALLPVLVAVALAVAQVLAAGVARELAGHAAQAGAMALLQREDPADAARDAVPGWSRGRLSVRRDGRRVRVRLHPPAFVPVLADLLVATRVADAGPSAAYRPPRRASSSASAASAPAHDAPRRSRRRSSTASRGRSTGGVVLSRDVGRA